MRCLSRPPTISSAYGRPSCCTMSRWSWPSWTSTGWSSAPGMPARSSRRRCRRPRSPRWCSRPTRDRGRQDERTTRQSAPAVCAVADTHAYGGPPASGQARVDAHASAPHHQGGIVKVLVTGGAGFIGSAVVQHLVTQGHDVIVADRFTYSGKARNLGPVLKDVQLLIGDLATGDLAARCAEAQPDWVVHLAAETHVDHAIAHPERFMWSNVVGTTRLLQALYAQEGPYPGKIVVYSTDEVFGPTPAGARFDEQAPFKPSNAYSASKVGVEGVATAFHVTHGFPTVIVRPCNTFGPGQHPEKAIPRWVGQYLRGEPMTLYNDGQGSRDWLHL